MRIRFPFAFPIRMAAMMMTMHGIGGGIIIGRHADKRQRLTNPDNVRFPGGGDCDPVKIAFEIEARCERNVRLLKLAHIRRGRIESVRINAWLDESDDLNPIPADLTSHLGQHRA
ncbi:hypothetical protein AW736_08085 [Termitidicoccus mucosus]|uniref:Uncharacterized protein n=1 Tax=Termitidicoccus mucosus TaxID=1184151 RepID=A0A178IM96_9BACT|nr:hypothetical protein AW736_08085 [Opitutaceae bacterium TSB47]